MAVAAIILSVMALNVNLYTFWKIGAMKYYWRKLKTRIGEW